MSQSSTAVANPPSPAVEPGTTCREGHTNCTTPDECRREWASSETGWRQIASRRVNWGLPGDRAVA
ncbi:hypothetical protein [Actinoplanes rectilineatus]|uniref:hypothetical protein n=1 Tax=Actinoplanes rectilineatus TaxID=113571 RepID=UPI0005F2B942|nr:hypothetical protein [Actinoplanes rectilineatus]